MHRSLFMSSLFLLVIESFLFVGCGGPTPPPQGYLFTDASHLLYLTWNQKDNQLSGILTSLSYQLPVLNASSQPQAQQLEYYGTMQRHQEVTLTVASTETLVGQLQQNTSRLLLSDTTEGGSQHLWYAVNQDDEHVLATAFSAFEHVHGALNLLANETAPEQMQALQTIFQDQVQQATHYVTLLQGDVTAMQRDLSEKGRCQRVDEVMQYYPANAGTFQVSPSPQQSSLAHDLHMAQETWNTAQHLSLPSIDGLSLPWQLSGRDVSTALRYDQTVLTQYQHLYQHNQSQMDTLKHTYEVIGQNIETIKQRC